MKTALSARKATIALGVLVLGTFGWIVSCWLGSDREQVPGLAAAHLAATVPVRGTTDSLDPERAESARSAAPSSIDLEAGDVHPAPVAKADPELPPFAARYVGMSGSELIAAGLALGDKRGERMLELAEARFQNGRFETRAFLNPGESTPRHTNKSPLITERVLPTGEYQVVEFAPEEYPELYENKAEQDWVFAEANRRKQ